MLEVEFNQEVGIDSVIRTVRAYQRQLQVHPLSAVMRSPRVPRGLLVEFASLQYIDSVMWVPMLALMKDRVAHPRLVKALTDNLLCEAGARHVSHVSLCKDFVESVGGRPYFGDALRVSSIAAQPVEIMNAAGSMSEGQIAGWILAAEALVPDLFKMVLPAYEAIPGCNTRYLREHVEVDSEEHSQWMLESVEALMGVSSSVQEVLEGVHLGGRTALVVPDALYAKFLRGEYGRAKHFEE